MGNDIALSTVPGRIVSLVPSQTELLFDLGLDSEIVGITRYCVHPTHWQGQKTIVGGTKTFDFAAIDNLRPDLIIGNKEENYREGIEALKLKYPVWMSDIATLEQALEMISALGVITNRASAGNKICESIIEKFKRVRICRPASVLYLIWRKPWMVAGKETFVDAMLNKIGLRNAIEEPRYPSVTPEMIAKINPDILMLSSEPFPFSVKHISELRSITPKSQIMLVDGEMFSWYGSRLQHAPEYFSNLSLPWN